MNDPQLKQQMAEFSQRKPYGPTDPPKKNKSIPTAKDPNLSPQERKVVYDDNMSESSWKGLTKNAKLTGKKITDKAINAALKSSQAKDSAFVVNNRVTKHGKYVNSQMAFKPKGDKGNFTNNSFSRNSTTGKIQTSTTRKRSPQAYSYE
jgi:hypothetical protein